MKACWILPFLFIACRQVAAQDAESLRLLEARERIGTDTLNGRRPVTGDVFDLPVHSLVALGKQAQIKFQNLDVTLQPGTFVFLHEWGDNYANAVVQFGPTKFEVPFHYLNREGTLRLPSATRTTVYQESLDRMEAYVADAKKRAAERTAAVQREWQVDRIEGQVDDLEREQKRQNRKIEELKQQQ